MNYPAFMQSLPKLDIPFPDDIVEAHAVRTETAMVVYFSIHKDFEIPEHSHGHQWGALFEGEITLIVNGEPRVCKPGDTWDLPAGTPHAAKLKAGARLMDVFEEPDRYPLRD